MTAVRRVLPSEYHKYRLHLKSLDEHSKYLRFGYAVKDEMIDKLCDSIEQDKDHHILFCVEGDDLEFIAVGHIALDNEMELAFSVLKDYQGQGLGNLLMRRCIQWCRIHGILKGAMVCLSSNGAIRHLCAKYGMKMTTEYGETLTNFEFDNAGIDTFVHEATDSNLAVIDWVAKRTNKMLKSAMNLA
jgi:GNAT superfamily N-acetyltransferase